jgi:hypothetical protein
MCFSSAAMSFFATFESFTGGIRRFVFMLQAQPNLAASFHKAKPSLSNHAAEALAFLMRMEPKPKGKNV